MIFTHFAMKPNSSDQRFDLISVEYEVVDRSVFILNATHDGGKPYQGSKEELTRWQEDIASSHIYEEEDA